MTDEEWLACSDPLAMLYAVRFRAGLRKLRLFAAACCRESEKWLLVSATQRGAVVLAQLLEGVIDEQSADQELQQTITIVGTELNFLAGLASVRTFGLRPVAAAVEMVQMLDRLIVDEQPGVREEASRRFCDLLREMLLPPGPLMQRSADWLRWHGRTVDRLARMIQQEERYEEMPVLADALEEAGCPEERILAHCRQAPFHCRGCWVLDLLLLGRE